MSNEIKKTEPTNPLIWTGLKFSRPCGTQMDSFRSLFSR